MSTASSVPIWITAVNAAPGSPQPKSSGKIRRWALLEIGRNSVRPWMVPSTTALRRSTRRRSLRGGASRRAGGPAGAGVTNLGRMQQRSLGSHRPQGLPARPRHDDLGPRHRRARGPRPADRLRRGRRHPPRHRGRLRRRRLRGADRHACSATWSPATRSCWRPRPGISRRTGRARSPTPRAGTCSPPSTPRCRRLGVDHVDLWQVHVWTDETPRRGDARPRSTTRWRPAGRRTSASPTTPAGRPRRPPPGSARCPGGRRWPPPRWSTPCSTAGSSTRSCPRPRRSASACCPGRRWAAAC